MDHFALNGKIGLWQIDQLVSKRILSCFLNVFMHKGHYERGIVFHRVSQKDYKKIDLLFAFERLGYQAGKE